MSDPNEKPTEYEVEDGVILDGDTRIEVVDDTGRPILLAERT
jgi:hypothetical protein